MPRKQGFYVFLAVVLVQIQAQVNFPANQDQTKENHRPQEISLAGLEQLSTLSKSNNLSDVLKKLLVERVVGTPGHEEVRQYIVDYMQKLSWTVELDEFEDSTPIFGMLKFSNIVATLNPNAERFLVLACHYDSKYFKNEVFIGATDSAVPCAMLLDLANSMKPLLESTKSSNKLSLQFVFFDGEEAFKQWGPTDSIYGARHLASRWEAEDKLKRIDILVLLDLLGAAHPNFYSYFKDTENWYAHLLSIEERLDKSGHLEHDAYSSVVPSQPPPARYFQPRSFYAYIEDDHIPFLQRQVPVLHIIPTPFPEVWHKLADDGSAVDLKTVQNLVKMFRVFIAEYLHLDL
ncbi:glutaminyl-peptide cyclotransferase-like [Sabethes cyaneus]|uniref:glutaminyl-peptide cyclotransferase-like n=1 Tax=Sabethes cyaneus TaxID=53552 RepID=UPI00237E26A0|nr:glutaminyl-peptide cyclotransferase-like [Sabethes cyaneus]